MKKLIIMSGLVGLIFASTVSFAALKGTINIAGSTSMQPLTEELAQAFMAKNKGVKIFIQGGGSSAGIKTVLTGTADIGTCSRELEPEEKGLLETVIAKDGIVLVVNKSNSITNLSLAQLQKIYTGEYQNWKEVNGPNEKIVVVNREAGSGTRGAFEELVLGKKLTNTNDCLVQASTGAVQQTVAVTKEAIGYISLGSLDQKSVKALKIENVACTDSNILARKYKIQRPFLMLTKKAPSGLTNSFIKWILSPEGQKIVAKEYIPVKK